MMGLCEDVRRLVDSCEYTYVCVACDDFADAICATHELIDSGIAEHGGSGAEQIHAGAHRLNAQVVLLVHHQRKTLVLAQKERRTLVTFCKRRTD